MEKENPISELLEKRGKCLVLGMALQFLIGLNYAFGVFQVPIMEQFGCSLSTVSLLSSLPGMLGVFFSLVMAAPLRSRLGFRGMILAGGLLYGLAYLTAGLNPGSSIFFLFVSLLAAKTIGSLMVDMPVKSYAVELFPDSAGRSSGLMTASFGAAAMVWAPVISALLTRVGSLSKTFLIIGGALCVLLPLIALRLIPVPGEFHKLFERKVTMQVSDAYYDVDRSHMVRLPVFYLFLTALAFTLACGNALLAQTAYFMEALLGSSAETAALAVSALALANMLGRLICGTIADRIGKLTTVFSAQLISVAALVLCALLSSPIGFLLPAMVVIFCFGGIFSLLSPLNAEVFGRRHMIENFTVFFAIPNVATLIGPTVTSLIVDRTASLSLTMFGCAAMGAAGVVAMGAARILLRRQARRHAEAD